MSKAKQLGDLMLNWSDNGRYLNFYNKNTAKFQPHPIAQSAYRSGSLGTGSNTATSANGLQMKNLGTYSANDGNRIYSVMFKGYISTGSHYFTWGLWNRTQTHWCVPVDQGNGYIVPTGAAWQRTISGVTYNCAITYRGSVHQNSSQTIAAFDLSHETHGDTMDLYMAASNSAGTAPAASASQTLYADDALMFNGTASGIQFEMVSNGVYT